MCVATATGFLKKGIKLCFRNHCRAFPSNKWNTIGEEVQKDKHTLDFTWTGICEFRLGYYTEPNFPAQGAENRGTPLAPTSPNIPWPSPAPKSALTITPRDITLSSR